MIKLSTIKTKESDKFMKNYYDLDTRSMQYIALLWLDRQVTNGGFGQWFDNGYAVDTISILNTIDTRNNPKLETAIYLANNAYNALSKNKPAQKGIDERYYELHIKLDYDMLELIR